MPSAVKARLTSPDVGIPILTSRTRSSHPLQSALPRGGPGVRGAFREPPASPRGRKSEVWSGGQESGYRVSRKGRHLSREESQLLAAWPGWRWPVDVRPEVEAAGEASTWSERRGATAVRAHQ